MPYSGYTVRRNKVLVGGQPDSNEAVLSGFLTSFRVDITGLQIHNGLNSGDIGINVQIVTRISIHLTENISGLILRQLQLDLNIRRSSLDSIVELVLLLVQIDLLTIGSYQEAILMHSSL